MGGGFSGCAVSTVPLRYFQFQSICNIRTNCEAKNNADSTVTTAHTRQTRGVQPHVTVIRHIDILPTDNIGTKNEVIKEQTSPNELNLVATKLFEDEERYVVLLHSWINPRHYTSGYFTAKTHLSLQHMIPLSAKSYSNWQWLQYTDSSHLSDLRGCCHFCLFCRCRTYSCLLDLHILTPILLSCTKITLTS
jgi:hypothetical protein